MFFRGNALKLAASSFLSFVFGIRFKHSHDSLWKCWKAFKWACLTNFQSSLPLWFSHYERKRDSKLSFCLVFASFFFNILMTWEQGFELADLVLDFSVLTENVSWPASFLLLPILRSFKNLRNAFHLNIFFGYC